MPDETSAETPPETVRQLQTPEALALGELTAIFEDLTAVINCCEQLLSELTRNKTKTNALLVEALWSTALISYRRCFSPQQHHVELTQNDLEETGVKGQVVDWHHKLDKMRAHFVDATANPRETFVVGISQDSNGNANGVAITSGQPPQLDETTVRQTGHLALELSRLVDKRINEYQQEVYTAARAKSATDLNALPAIEVIHAKASEDEDSP